MLLPEEVDDGKPFMEAVQDNTDPDAVRLACELPPHPEAKELRQLLTTASKLVKEAKLEPVALQAGAQDAVAWDKVIADSNALLTRIAALQVLIEGVCLLHDTCSNTEATLCSPPPRPACQPSSGG